MHDLAAPSVRHRSMSHYNSEEKDRMDINDTTSNRGMPAAYAPQLTSQEEEDEESCSDEDDEDALLTLDIDEAIELLGMGPFQTRILWAAGLCFAADSMEIMLLQFLSFVLKAEWNLTDTQTASITTSVFLGALIGTLVLGMLGDYWGRKPVFSLTAAIIAVFGLATAGATNFYQLLFVRAMVGFGVGGLTVPFDTLAEFVPTSHRGQNLMAIEYFWVAGSLLVPAIASVTLSHGWRLFVVVCSIPCFISTALGIVVVPESPRWLITQGQQQRALRVLRRAAAVNGKNPLELFPPQTVLTDATAAEQAATICDLLCTPTWRRITCLLAMTYAGFAISYYGSIMAITGIFSQAETADTTTSSTSSSSTSSDEYSFDFGAIFTSSASELVGTTYVILLIDRVGRVRTQSLSYFLGGICILILCCQDKDTTPRSHKIVMAFLARLFFMGGSCSTWVATAELLTTEVRTAGHSLANAVGRMGGGLSPYLVSNGAPLPVVGIILCLASWCTAMTTSFLPETAGQSLGTVKEPAAASAGGAGPATKSDQRREGMELPVTQSQQRATVRRDGGGEYGTIS